MIYTGIGSRATPIVVLNLMTEIGSYFGKNGITLRSGGAAGADSAFEAGCDFVKAPKQIFLPSRSFNGHTIEEGVFYTQPQLAFDVAEKVWNSRSTVPIEWKFLKPFTKMLMARNTMQILGAELDSPTDLVVCWTEDGEATGGTGQALSMVEQINNNTKLDYMIPIINLQKETHRNLITDVLKGSNPNEFITALKGFYKEQKG